MKLTQEIVEKYVMYLDTARYSMSIKKNYMYFVIHLINREINQDTINQVCNSMPTSSRNMNADRVAHPLYRSFLKNLIGYLNLRDIIIPRLRGRQLTKEVIYYTDKEMDIILKGVTDVKLNLIIRLMYEDGLRISEALSLQKNSFDMVNQRIRFIGKGNKQVSMAIHKDTYQIVTEYLEEFQDEDYIFRFGHLKHQRQKALYEIKKEVIPLLPHKSKEIFCHAFRHTCGTHLLEKDFNMREIQVYLRHSDLSTIERYTSVDKVKLEQKIDEKF